LLWLPAPRAITRNGPNGESRLDTLVTDRRTDPHPTGRRKSNNIVEGAEERGQSKIRHYKIKI
jgi:hypothetical protein